MESKVNPDIVENRKKLMMPGVEFRARSRSLHRLGNPDSFRDA
jgi:hypothetical protein